MKAGGSSQGRSDESSRCIHPHELRHPQHGPQAEGSPDPMETIS
jgi:hypothetical protein